jgi:hypothetical protein
VIFGKTSASKMSMSRREIQFANAAAAVRDYTVEPRLEYRTIAGVQGPLVILENVKAPRFAEIVNVVISDGNYDSHRKHLRLNFSLLR